MRLILIHGINQQGRSSKSILHDWLLHLANPACLKGVEVVAPFYGDVLAEQTAATPEQAVAQGIPREDEERDFVANALQQLALDRGLTDEMISNEQIVTQGPLDDRRLLAILRLLERVSPLQGSAVLLLVRQAYAYLKRNHVADAVDSIVEPALAQGPCAVVGHSLGSVVGFKLLRKLGQTVPLFLTLGSPLGLVAVQSALKRPRRVPVGVARWFNGLDPDDAVTLGKPLTAETFAAGIVNKTDIENGEEAHAIKGYFADPVVRQEICSGVVS